MTIELAITPDSRWEVTTEDLVRAAEAAGFAAVGITATRVTRAAAAAYRAVGLRCHEVLALVVSDLGAETVRLAEAAAEAAAIMNAEWVLTVFRSPLSPQLLEVVRRCAAVFSNRGAGMAVEFSPLGPVSSITAGLEIVHAANSGDGRGGLMIDSWHFCVGPSTWEELEAVPLDLIAYLQFADALAPESDDLFSETMNRRALPGEGVLELGRFATTLRDRGWEGLVSVELFNRDYRSIPASEVAFRIRQATAPYWL